jgi:hypothetical protein
MNFERPAGITDAQWASIERHVKRVQSAEASSDYEDQLGRAKDLVETVAKVICDACSVVFPANEEFSPLLSKALTAIERKAGTGSAADGHLRSLCQVVSKGVGELNHARRVGGSGHGRSVIEPVDPENAEMAVGFANLWCRWALKRLEAVQARTTHLQALLHQLIAPEVFRAGELTAQLARLDLESLDPDDQRRLGVAVGRRAVSGTFVVAKDGVQPLSQSPDAFTEEYRLGLLEGLLLDSGGRVHPFGAHLESIIGALSGVSVTGAKQALQLATNSDWLFRLSAGSQTRRTLVEDMKNLDRTVPKALRPDWLELAEWLDDEPDEAREDEDY